MPKPALYALIWSPEHGHYALQSHREPEQCFHRGDEPAFARWLETHTSFAFVGQAGRLSVIKEARPRGAGYWYAYRRQDRHTRKRYLGSTARVTFTRLEQVATGFNRSSSPPPLAQMPTSPSSEQRRVLLSTKLTAPRLPIWLVERSRLLRELDAVRCHPLTLVSASAGSGKTTLLSAWAAAAQSAAASVGRAQGAGHRVVQTAFAWLSLDALDTEPTRFWTSVMAAIRTTLPLIGQTAFVLLHSQEAPPLSTILTALLNELEQVGTDLILILDDYHVISDQAIHESMLFLLDHLPVSMHLVLATRTDPELPLSRLRVRGQLLEIRDQDLRFSRAETTSFLLQGMGLPLSEEEVAILETRTEGWVAGLQLAALSLRKREDPSAFVRDFAGSHRYLLDYVQQDILAQLPGPLQDFLLQTAILPRMNAAICQAVTAGPSLRASQQMLEEVERANLFVVSLDSKRQWYRYHDLFREALYVRLHASQPELVPVLHQRAASFYEAAGELREAIVHALAAADFSYAARLLECAAPSLWLSGEAQTVLTWMAALPDAILSSHSRLALDASRYLLESLYMTVRASYVKTLALVEQVLGRVETLLQRQDTPSDRSEAEDTVPDLPDAEMAVVQRRLRLLRALIAARARVLGDDAKGLRHLVMESEGLSEREEVSWKMIWLFLTFLLTETLRREGALLIKRMLEAKRQVLEAADHRASIRVRLWLAFAYLRAGWLRLVEQECLEGLAVVEHIGEQTAMTGYLHYFLADTYFAWNRLEEASSSLQQQQRIAQSWQQWDLLIVGNTTLAQVEIARGDLAAADHLLHQAETLVQQERLAIHAFWVVAARVRYWLAAGDLDAASHWAEHVVFFPETWDPNHKGAVLMQIRVSLAQQQYTQALQALERFSAYLDRPGDIKTTIEFLALKVVALHQAGKSEQIQAVAARLLTLTEPEGSMRVYLDLGAPMKQVLLTLLAPLREQPEQARRAPTRSLSFVAHLLAAFEQEEQQGRASPLAEPLPEPPLALAGKSGSASPVPVEPLTRREQEVLRLLADGASNQEIANALVIQLSTVKKHVSNLLRKLGAASRTLAIAQARAVSLL
ncbi:MAG: LuxR C-terminal-related transcriptional regulator [Ktedonobacterales bacterium]